MQAAAKPKSPVGDMLAYYLKAQPHLFKDAIAEQFIRLRDQRDAESQSLEADKDSKKPKAADKSEMVLYRCSLSGSSIILILKGLSCSSLADGCVLG